MVRLGQYFRENHAEWQSAVEKAGRMNGWFTPEFIDLAVRSITTAFLQEDKLRQWLAGYPGLRPDSPKDRKVGLVMAGNIPLVGFHDFLSVYLSGYRLYIKLSSKDTVLWEHIFGLLGSWDDAFAQQVTVSDMLKGCDAYIATGSNNSARYFEQYFRKYPHIIRRNRTSVAVLDGAETPEMLELLADDVCTYYGLGCRNVTKIFVPEGYDFTRLLPAFDKYSHHLDHHKYKNNYDYQLAIFLLNKVAYMTNGSILLAPSESPFAAIGVLHYEHYSNKEALLETLRQDDRLQCITTNGAQDQPGRNFKCFGGNQAPELTDYADGIDTLQFLSGLNRPEDAGGLPKKA